MTKEQNLESPSHSSSYRVLPQQQQQTKTPLNIVPKIKVLEVQKLDFEKSQREHFLEKKLSVQIPMRAFSDKTSCGLKI